MGKNDLERATVEDFFYWINERHRIYVKRFEDGTDKPWTEDSILQEWKFTNVFRQLDRGTIALNKMLDPWHNSDVPLREMDVVDAIDILFNIIWYRMFNVDVHAENIGFVHHKDHKILEQYLVGERDAGRKVFTGAHMTTGTGKVVEMRGKLYAHLVAAMEVADEEHGEDVICFILNNQNMCDVWRMLKQMPMCGPFIAYEMVCDLRFTPLLCEATDKLTWANLGPGAVRGLQRLGMPATVASMRELYHLAIDEEKIEYHVAEHLPFNEKWPPFELREIEHSLCEFDKYMRVKTGAGRPRGRFNGK